MLSPEEAETLGRLLTRTTTGLGRRLGSLRRFEALPQVLCNRQPSDGETRLKISINTIMISLMDRMIQHAPKLDPNLSTSQHTVEIFLRRLEHVIDQGLDARRHDRGMRPVAHAFCRSVQAG